MYLLKLGTYSIILFCWTLREWGHKHTNKSEEGGRDESVRMHIHTQFFFPFLSTIFTQGFGWPEVIIDTCLRCQSVRLNLKSCGWEASFFYHTTTSAPQFVMHYLIFELQLSKWEDIGFVAEHSCEFKM